MSAKRLILSLKHRSRRQRQRENSGKVAPIDFGDFRRVEPISRAFGFERGTPVDRYYIHRFLQENSRDIRGRTLEVGEPLYTRQYGGDQVTQSDVINLMDGVPNTTIVADLAHCNQIPDNTFDCFIFTQTLQFIYEVRLAIASIHRILKPGGVLLGTFPALSQICRYDMDRWGDYWRFTKASIHNLLSEAFGAENIHVEIHGNVLAGLCFLQGLAAEELTSEELSHLDEDYPILVTARAVKQLWS